METKVDIVVEICALLAEQENLTVTLYESAKGAGLMGASAMLGGMLGGKNGMLIGGAIGGAMSMLWTSNFKSIPDIIREDMSKRQKEMLFRLVNGLLRGVAITDVKSVMQYLALHVAVKNNVLSTLTDFLKTNMKLSM